MKKVVVFALHCHPDDIEFTMAGTLFRLKEKGCELHYMTVANGSCGTVQHSREEIIEIRRQESIKAADFIGAAYHDSIVDDFEVFYTQDLIRKITAIIRSIKPRILLLPSPWDYMEDHMNTCRIGTTAAFCKGISNYHSIPNREAYMEDVTLYHCLPHGLVDGMRNKITPDIFIDINEVIEKKEAMLAFHQSQKRWLDVSQGMDSYLASMKDFSREVGKMSGTLVFAEGFRRHSHLGYSKKDEDPLSSLLSQK